MIKYIIYFCVFGWMPMGGDNGVKQTCTQIRECDTLAVEEGELNVTLKHLERRYARVIKIDTINN